MREKQRMIYDGTLKQMLGKQGSETTCTRFIHWFATDAKTGDKCLCGKTVKEARRRKGKKV